MDRGTVYSMKYVQVHQWSIRNQVEICKVNISTQSLFYNYNLVRGGVRVERVKLKGQRKRSLP
jgi:hypothetical protein